MSGSTGASAFAVVLRCLKIAPHPDPAVMRLDVLTLSNGVQLVTGKHYREGDLGLYIRPGSLVPGYLAADLWLPGKTWFECRSIPIGVGDGPRVESPGLWAGSFWRESAKHEFIPWRFWKDSWQIGNTLDGYFGIVENAQAPYLIRFSADSKKRRHRHKRPHSSAAEQPVTNRTVAAKTTTGNDTQVSQAAAVEASGSNPAVGSTLIQPWDEHRS